MILHTKNQLAYYVAVDSLVPGRKWNILGSDDTNPRRADGVQRNAVVQMHGRHSLQIGGLVWINAGLGWAVPGH